MVLLTMIARLADGLPLAASMQEDEQVIKKRRKTLGCVVSGLYDVCLLALLMASSFNGANLERNVTKYKIEESNNNNYNDNDNFSACPSTFAEQTSHLCNPDD